jgi:uncharacterized protein YoxC
MTVGSVAAALAAVAWVAVALFLVPALIELRRTVVALRSLLSKAEEELPSTLAETREILTDLKTITKAAASKADEVKTVMTALGDTGESVHRINGLLDGFVNLMRKPARYWAGTRAAGKYILDRVKKKEE